MSKNETDLLFWLDMEMSGLDPVNCRILEIACIVTDLRFEKKDRFHAVVFQPKDVLDQMDEWCTKTHGESGLTQEVAGGQPIEMVEKTLIEFTLKHFPNGKAILAGNSIWQDRKFVDLYLPEFSKHLHYRMVDVSGFKEIFKNRFGVFFKKKETHRAKDDIDESVDELAHYVQFISIPENPA